MSEDSRVFQNEGLWKVWTWCLMRAAWEGHWVDMKVGRQKTEVWVEPGQFIFGRYSAAEKLKMKPSTVWKRMQKLKNMRNCDIKSNSKYTVVSIINWDIYQPKENEGNIKGDSQGTVKEHKEESKEGKEGKEDSLPLSVRENGIPYEDILEAYHNVLPELPKVKVFSKKRKSMLKARWNEDEKRQSLDWWNGYFEYVRKSPFLMGEINHFQASLEWLIRPNNFLKVNEGNYHRL
jgi:hypothetical protein